MGAASLDTVENNSNHDYWRGAPPGHYSERCGKMALLGHGPGLSPVIAPYRCKSWLCERGCGERRGQYWYARLMAGQEYHGRHHLKFATFTFDRGAAETSEQAFKLIGPAWNRLRSTLTRRFGTFQYARVIERHKDGWPHVHCLVAIDGYVPQKWLSQVAQKAGFGRIVDIRSAKKQRTGNYLAKYLVKQRLYLPTGIRRAVTSREWAGENWKMAQPVKSPYTWELVDMTPDLLQKALLRDGHRARILGEEAALPGPIVGGDSWAGEE